MAIFASSPAVQTTTVTNSATLIFDTDASNIPAGVTLHDVTIINTGTVNIYLGGSTVTAATGLQLQPGAQITYDGYSHVTTDSTGDIYAITSSGSAVALAGLATVNSNV